MLQGPRMNSRGMQHPFMGPGYMGSHPMHPRQMRQGQFGPRPRMQQGQFAPMMGRNPQSRQGGGLLAKLLGKGGGRGQGGGMSGFMSPGSGPARAASSGGGILKTLTDPAALNGFLSNSQKVLNSAQQFGPMIQQYSPLVRNLPSMWKLYRGLKDLPDAEENEEEEKETVLEKNEKTAAKKNSAKSAAKKKTSGKKQGPKGSSSPKLFI